MFLYEHASSHCSLLWHANTLFTNKITHCVVGFYLYTKHDVCSVPFLSYMNMLVPIVLVVDTKGCLQTNYGDAVKFIAVPSFTCVHVWLVHVHYINMHVPLFFAVVFTQVHCLPTNYDDIVVTTLLDCQCR